MNNQSHNNSKIIALDIGEQRIGIATASLIARLPNPWGVVKQSENVFKDIVELLEKESVAAVVVGLPRGLDSQETQQTAYVREFTEKLKGQIKIPVYFQDEALTSKQAEKELQRSGKRYNKEDVDALAAVYILSDFLHEHPGTPSL